MLYNSYPSKLLESAIEELSKLPGIGKKTALRLVLHLLRQDKESALKLGNAIIQLRNEIKYCTVCKNISETDTCSICSDNTRNKTIICIVENIRDVISVENTGQFKGLYHVLGGIISPMDGIGPNDLTIKDIDDRIKGGEVKEIIITLSTTMEGDTTAFYLYKRFHSYNILITTIARGVSVGDELEYTDDLTLGRSIVNRMPFENSINKNK